MSDSSIPPQGPFVLQLCQFVNFTMYDYAFYMVESEELARLIVKALNKLFPQSGLSSFSSALLSSFDEEERLFLLPRRLDEIKVCYEAQKTMRYIDSIGECLDVGEECELQAQADCSKELQKLVEFYSVAVDCEKRWYHAKGLQVPSEAEQLKNTHEFLELLESLKSSPANKAEKDKATPVSKNEEKAIKAEKDKAKAEKDKAKPISKDEANIKAREYLQQHPNATSRELAGAIRCAQGLVSKLPAWKAVMEERRKPRRPKAVNFSPTMEAITGETDSELQSLISGQEIDGRTYRIRKEI